MTPEEARAYVKKNGPLPEPPDPSARTCGHTRPCSCHLTLEQHSVASALGAYTLYLFGRPYRGRVKVPYYPSAVEA